MNDPRARDLWHALEPINAVTYFSPESQRALAGLGCRGFWMGYFAARAAPMGAVGPATVEATFFNFHPARVRRAIPDAWSFASPSEVLTARSEAAAASLRRLLSSQGAEELAISVRPALEAAIAAAPLAGKPLFAANVDVPRPEDPVAALWQAATTLREHRGDCHVSLLASHGLDGLEALVLFAVSEHIEPAVFVESRGWSIEEWHMAQRRLVRRGLVGAGPVMTDDGRELRQRIERRTDELAATPYGALSRESTDTLVETLHPAARLITSSGEIPFPNPIGLPPATTR